MATDMQARIDEAFRRGAKWQRQQAYIAITPSGKKGVVAMCVEWELTPDDLNDEELSDAVRK
jgi:hypothetical protein